MRSVINQLFVIGRSFTAETPIRRFRSAKAATALLTASILLPTPATAQFSGLLGNVIRQASRPTPPPVSAPGQPSSASPTVPYPGESTASIYARSARPKIRYNEPLPMDSPPLAWLNYYQDTYTPSIVHARGFSDVAAAQTRMTFISLQCQVRLYSEYPDQWRCVEDETEQHEQLIKQHDAGVTEKARETAQVAVQAARDNRDPRVHAARIRACKIQIAKFETELKHEQQIGQVSGVVNMQTLHSWGQDIVVVQTQMDHEYVLYRKTGGTKSLSAL